MSKQRAIQLRGVRTHNLKNIHCEFPHGSFTVVTGPSGSGKSSLAFDTLYAEGQRRFMESMSTYARQFLERIEKPDVDQITHILPAIALEQKNHVKNARSTVGTATEIYDFLRLLYATVGQTICHKCNLVVETATPQDIEAFLTDLPNGTKAVITAPVEFNASQLPDLIAQGYFRAWINNELVDLNQGLPEGWQGEHLEIVIDRVVLKGKDSPARLIESIRQASKLNPDQLCVYTLEPNPGEHRFKTQFACPNCHKSFEPPFANLFSFNHPLGACPSCEGFGRIIGLDLGKVIPNHSLSLEQGAIHPFNTPANQEIFADLVTEAKKRKIRLDVPFDELTEAEKTFALDGAGTYPGVYGFFNWLESKKYKVHVRVMLAKYRGYYPCPDCDSSRLNLKALWVEVGRQTIHQLCQIPVSQLLPWFKALSLPPESAHRSQRLLREIRARLAYLEDIGLGYLTLARQSRTLSGGEAQRINLSSALGTALTDTLYVLDEPTVGLHARDTARLLVVLSALRDQGNTIVVVEHDPDVILGGDRVLDIGPHAGRDGGHVVYEGDTKAFLDCGHSQTAEFIKNPPRITPNKLNNKDKSPMRIVGATGNNLKNISVELPKNQLICVAGVSGSGKSTLIKQTLYTRYQQAKGQELALDVAPCQSIEGFDAFEDLILVDQSPPGRSIRSNPVTYVKAYDEIRKLFAGTRQAKALGITASHFSFNTAGGRCETCEGLGTITIDMQFMADVTVTCEACQGKRFSPAVLAITVEDKTIKDVLDMTVDEALTFFKAYKRVTDKLLPLKKIGLSYLHLGQSTNTLSGGEAQRLKLAAYLSQTHKGKPYLFLFDEPTTGLHLSDVQVLVEALRELIAAGHSVIVIEHNIEFLAHADYLIELGPEGGENGGQLIAQGAPDQLVQSSQSITGPYITARLTQKYLLPL